jgi:Domain of unknown function (DUF1918)
MRETSRTRREEKAMDVNVGDRLVLESERVGQPSRTGTVEEVMSVDPLRLRVRWADHSVSIINPQGGAARVERGAQSRTKASRATAARRR